MGNGKVQGGFSKFTRASRQDTRESRPILIKKEI